MNRKSGTSKNAADKLVKGISTGDFADGLEVAAADNRQAQTAA